MSPITLKILFNDELRRLKVDDRAAFKIESLRDVVSELFSLQNYSICYVDDENDTINIGSSEEIQEAFRLFPNSQSLRLTVKQADCRLPLAERSLDLKQSQAASKYDIMRRAGVPVLAVEQKKMMDSHGQTHLRKQPHAASKYDIMRRAGVPVLAVEQKKMMDSHGQPRLHLPLKRAPKPVPKPVSVRSELLSTIRAGKPLKKTNKADPKPHFTAIKQRNVMPCLKQRLLMVHSGSKETKNKDEQLQQVQMKLTEHVKHGKLLQNTTEQLQQHTQQHLTALSALTKGLEQMQRSVQSLEQEHQERVQQHVMQMQAMQDETKSLFEQVQRLQQTTQANATQTESNDAISVIDANLPFSTELTLLAEMGFTNQHRLRKLLEREAGDVGRVINSPGLFPSSSNPSAFN